MDTAGARAAGAKARAETSPRAIATLGRSARSPGMRPIRFLVLLASASVLGGAALAQTPASRPYAPKPAAPSVVPRHIPTPKPIAPAPPKPDYTRRSMQIIQQNLLQQQMRQPQPPSRAQRSDRRADARLLTELIEAAAKAPPDPPKLAYTPETLELARRVVRAQLAHDPGVAADADGIAASALLAKSRVIEGTEYGPAARTPVDPAEVGQALREAQAPLWGPFLEDMAVITAQTYTPAELKVIETYLTSPEYPGIAAKQQTAAAPWRRRVAVLREARNRTAVEALCARHGKGSAYCYLAAGETDIPGAGIWGPSAEAEREGKTPAAK